MTATTLPEDRPWTFTPTGRHTLDSTSPDFGWVMDDLREHDAIATVLTRTADTPPWQIVYMRRGRIGIRINTATAVFTPTARSPRAINRGDDVTYELDVKRTMRGSR